MGFALARVALRRGARVTLVSGPTPLSPPEGARFVAVTSAQEMHQAVMDHLGKATVVIKAAAVADYRPRRFQGQKIKKGEESFSLSLERTKDILSEVGARKGKRLLIGFAAETHDLQRHAQEKLRKKNLDWIVANDVTEPGAGFASDTNRVLIIHRDGTIQELPQMSKEEVAWAILDLVAQRRGKKGGGHSGKQGNAVGMGRSARGAGGAASLPPPRRSRSTS
jgi:phosphopantothenoylcysteine decarboxylase/phosphopantothenate--cysteine ligase